MKPSELKKLAKACREAGIKHFKNADLEFTLTDEEPVVRNLKPVALTKEELEKEPESDGQMSEEQMLFYSVMDVNVESNSVN